MERPAHRAVSGPFDTPVECGLDRSTSKSVSERADLGDAGVDDVQEATVRRDRLTVD
jgi:hypothetical protein